MAGFLKAVRERVVIYDGAMGTNIQWNGSSPSCGWGFWPLHRLAIG